MRPSNRRHSSRRSSAVAAGLALALAGLVLDPWSGTERAAAGTELTGSRTPGHTVERPFGKAFNREIPADPAIDTNSGSIIDYLAADGLAYANLYDYGTPIYYADNATPRVEIECTEPWGPCDLEEAAVPIPQGAEPNTGSDAAMVVVDRDTGRSIEFWQATPGATSWSTSWGEIVSVDSKGGYGSTGSGISRLAGVIRTAEIEAGSIEHALVFATDNSCGTFRAPATKSDGASDRTDCIPEGARVQLDPAVDLSALSMSKAERAVAVALQRYGAYNIDNAGARMAVMFERPTTGTDPYPAAGLHWDYYAMEDIPWHQLRVLGEWDGK